MVVKRRFSNNRLKPVKRVGKSVKVTTVMFGVIGSALLVLVVIFGVTFSIMSHLGKNSLYNKTFYESAPSFGFSSRPESYSSWQDDWVYVDGQIYSYNHELLTFLIMGIDHVGEVEEAENYISGGQADALFLIVCNPNKKQIDIIAINRNTMAEIDRYNEVGDFVESKVAQIAVQHGYGDGLELSCERSVEAVSKLFYQMPIHGYASINMSAIEEINDAVGGVEVVVQEEVELPTNTFKAGEKVVLEGVDAFWYLKHRDTSVYQSADMRLERQKQYIIALAKQMMGKMKTNPLVAWNIYQLVQEYMVTDITVSEMTYMASVFSTYDFTMEHMHSTVGETVQGTIYEEFYLEEEEFYQLILDVFYELVEE